VSWGGMGGGWRRRSTGLGGGGGDWPEVEDK
jgi:hypothetical protein